MVGLYLWGLFQPEWFYDSMIMPGLVLRRKRYFDESSWNCGLLVPEESFKEK